MNIFLFWYRYTLYTKWRRALPNKSHLKNHKHIIRVLSILQNLRGHMTYFVTWRRKRYENVCEIYGTYIKWPQNDL